MIFCPVLGLTFIGLHRSVVRLVFVRIYQIIFERKETRGVPFFVSERIWNQCEFVEH